MFAQKIAKSSQPAIPADSLLARYLEGQDELETLYDGAMLAATVRAVLPELPTGPLVLLASSTAGAGLAAACAAQRTEPTTWLSVDLRLPAVPIDRKPVVVEPIDAGAGWRDALLNRYPHAEFITARAVTPPIGLAA